jgi:YVTN family beta-propeller protein
MLMRIGGRVSGKFILAAVGVASLCAGALGQGKTPSPALLVLSKEESFLAIVDPATLKVVGKVDTGAHPHEVATSADGKIAIVTNYGNDHAGTTMSEIDLASRSEVGKVTFPGLVGPHGIAILGDKAYFTVEGDQSVGVFDFVANNIDLHLVLGQKRPHMLVLTKDGRTMCVSNIESNTVSVEEMKKKITDWTGTNVKVGKGPEGIDISPDEKEVWAANSGDGTVSIIDVKSKKVVATVDVKTKHSNRLKFTPDGKLVLISDIGSGDLVVVDAASRKEVKRLNLGKSAEGILMQPDGARAFVAVSGDDKVAVVDLKTLEVTTTFTIGKDPDGMAWRK